MAAVTPPPGHLENFSPAVLDGESRTDGAKGSYGVQDSGDGRIVHFWWKKKEQSLPKQKQDYVQILRHCANTRSLSEGRKVHEQIEKRGLGRIMYLGNLLIEMYGKCDAVADARKVFEAMPQRNVFSWTAMIVAYTLNGHDKDALKLFPRMQSAHIKMDKVCFLAFLKACTGPESFSAGKIIHACIVYVSLELDFVVGTAIMRMCGMVGNLDHARMIFERMQQPNIISWNTMIAAYIQCGENKEALRFFRKMLTPPDSFTFSTLLAACTEQEDLPQVYANNRHVEQSFELFQQMQNEGVKPDSITFCTILAACAGIGALSEGRIIHAQIIESDLEFDVVVASSLINMYSRCGNLVDARSVFDKIPHKDIASWNGMIAAYAQHGCGVDAMKLLLQLQGKGIKPNVITFSSILSVCSHAGFLNLGCHFFVSIREAQGIVPLVEHYGCVIDLLGRAGWLDEAEDFVNRMPIQPDDTAWTALLVACRTHDDILRARFAAEQVLQLAPDNAGVYILLSHVCLGDSGYLV